MLEISATAVDDLIGIYYLAVRFDDDLVYSSSPGFGIYASYPFVTMGSARDWEDGSHSEDWGVSTANTPGILNVSSVYIVDMAGNERTYSASELQGMGINTQIDVIGSAADTTPPTLLTLNIPSTIDLGDGEAVLEISATAVDDLIGIYYLAVRFDDDLVYSSSPGFGIYASYPFVTMGSARDWEDGSHSEDWGVSTANTPGILNVSSVYIVDMAGNERTYSTSELQGMGINTQIELREFSDLSLTGDSGANTLEGGAGNDLLSGLAGPDVLNGGEGSDTLRGGLGRDSLDGGAGADLLQGGYGNDRYYVDNTGDRIIERPDNGYDRVFSSVSYHLNEQSNNVEELALTGSADVDGSGNFLSNRVYGNDGRNSLSGGIGDDSLFGGMKADALSGGRGNDLLAGGMGSDLLMGGQGEDVLRGSRGNDTLRGGGGDDELTGGQGVDIFVLEVGSGHDVVTDFTLSGDFVAVDGATGMEEVVISEAGEGAVASWADSSLTLLGVDAGLLTSDHFQFF